MKNNERKPFIEDFVKSLEEKGYIKLTREEERIAKRERPSCVEIQMKKGSQDYFFSVMIISKNKAHRYYDYISLPEWIFAFRHIDNYNFVVIRKDAEKGEQRIYQITPSVMLAKVQIPPYKTSFSLTKEELSRCEKEKNDKTYVEMKKFHDRMSKVRWQRTRKIEVSPKKMMELVTDSFPKENV